MSRTFEHPNLHGGWTCPVCRTAADAPVVLVPIPGTERDGIVEAQQVHADCAALVERMNTLAEKEGGE